MSHLSKMEKLPQTEKNSKPKSTIWNVISPLLLVRVTILQLDHVLHTNKILVVFEISFVYGFRTSKLKLGAKSLLWRNHF